MKPLFRKLYFDEEAHKYTDEFGNPYTSMTTLIHKYADEFKTWDIAEACANLGRRPVNKTHKNYEKYLKYRGKSAKQLVYEWEQKTIEACAKGTKKHNYLESTIKNHNNYYKKRGAVIDKVYQLYTINDIEEDSTIGEIKLEEFNKDDIKNKYPDIFETLRTLVGLGFKLYAELGVYDPDRLISGLIDLIAIRIDVSNGITTKEFIIIDWKTNAAPIRFESGYYEKDKHSQLTDRFIKTDKFFYSPLDYLPNSVGNTYSLQVSGYAALVESFGYKNLGNILYQIRDIDNKEVVSKIEVLDLRREFDIMATNYSKNCIKLTQSKLF